MSDASYPRSLLSRHLAVLLLAASIACGKASTTTPTPVQSNTITITSSGVSPKNVQIAAGSRVLFVNSDSRAHTMNSDPHPEHSDCPEINQVGFLSPNERRETGNFVTTRTCGFHDHDDATNASLKGTITIQ